MATAGTLALLVGVAGLAGAFDESTDDGAVAATTTTVFTGTTMSAGTTAVAETPEEFFALFSAAIRSRDAAFLVDRLHPFVLERYGDATCRAYLAQLDVPRFEARVLSTGAVQPWDWVTDGITRTVTDAIPVRVTRTENGSTYSESDTHVVRTDGRVRWFTDCGAPVAGAR
jgi:hypothetical protein